ncbi:hypothetical protein PIB30_057380 [Stylosanthes scabra]|uniref:Uncharacterized protein n=1 Tax=Stylosanthes scabra TaxID=79078 RepID=A0ABU6RKP8_9FABA|nr:hypothetical protein [Stylosanthes scabra]
MFQRPRTIALEYEKPGTYGTVLIYPLNHLVECGFVGNTTVNPWVGIVCRRQAFARESESLMRCTWRIYPCYKGLGPLLCNMRSLGLMEGVDLPTRPFGREYTPWNPTPYQPHDLGYNAYQSNGFGDAYYGYDDPSPPYPPSQNGMDELFEVLS